MLTTQNSKESLGHKMHNFARDLWPINRSITGDGVRVTLQKIKAFLPELNIYEVKSGEIAFDWTVPKEWNVKNAWIITPGGQKICDFSVNNLHLVGYSIPIHKKMTLEELQPFLYSLPDQPNAIPYVTSYYSERWGFCISENQRATLKDGEYEVFVDSELKNGSLTYAEIFIPGEKEQEIFLSTYVCHPSMANNELSGPVVTTFLAQWIKNCSRKYSYRIVFLPETIGSIVYLSRKLEHLKKHVVAGFNITCVGDDRAYSYLPSRKGNTISDIVALHVLKNIDPSFKLYTWRDRGSDERQYCAPLVDLPIATIMRSKYGEYPEYHTSLDNLEDVVTPSGLQGGFDAIKSAISIIEKNAYPLVKVLCEPQLGKRGLYPQLSTKKYFPDTRLMMDVISWSDGDKSLLEIADLCNVPFDKIEKIVNVLSNAGLLEMIEK